VFFCLFFVFVSQAKETVFVSFKFCFESAAGSEKRGEERRGRDDDNRCHLFPLRTFISSSRRAPTGPARRDLGASIGRGRRRAWRGGSPSAPLGVRDDEGEVLLFLDFVFFYRVEVFVGSSASFSIIPSRRFFSCRESKLERAHY